MEINEKSKYILLNTVFVGDNFGSSLQAFALKHFISSVFDVPCYIVARREVGYRATVYRLRIKVLNFLKSFLSIKLFVRTWGSQINKFRKKSKVDIYPEKIRESFVLFTKEHIKPIYLPQKELKRYAHDENCICCITGSDQIWNPTANFMQPNNFLMFSPKKKNISYAASIGATQIPYYNYVSFKRNINNIKQVSVREETAGQLLFDEFGVTSKVCVDPVVLVGKEFWLAGREPIEGYGLYTFCYFLNKPSKQALELISERAASGEKVFVLSRKDVSQYNAKVQMIEDISPLQFVSYIQDAGLVLTDSFHGMMFSILLNKNFFVFERDYENYVPQPSRIVTLLDQLGISERYIQDGDTITENNDMDYDSINEIMRKKQKASAEFLKEAIGNAACGY